MGVEGGGGDTKVGVEGGGGCGRRGRGKWKGHTYFRTLTHAHSLMHMCSQTTLRAFKKTDFSSIREHEEFIWLHDRFTENEDYAGIIVST